MKLNISNPMRRLAEKRKDMRDKIINSILEEIVLVKHRNAVKEIECLARASKAKGITESQTQQAQMRREHLLHSAVDEHYLTLKRTMKKALHINEFGLIEADERILHFSRFLKSYGFIIPDTAADERHTVDANYLSQEHVRQELEKLKARIDADDNRNVEKFDPDTLPSNGLDFESWVASSLSKFGWKTTVSKGSGDQGIDVVAQLDGVTVGIQCKLYTGSVGNKAVQEVISGIAHYGLDHAVVISNATYTKSAYELALSTNVLLLSHNDIPDLSLTLRNRLG